MTDGSEQIGKKAQPDGLMLNKQDKKLSLDS